MNFLSWSDMNQKRVSSPSTRLSVLRHQHLFSCVSKQTWTIPFWCIGPQSEKLPRFQWADSPRDIHRSHPRSAAWARRRRSSLAADGAFEPPLTKKYPRDHPRFRGGTRQLHHQFSPSGFRCLWRSLIGQAIYDGYFWVKLCARRLRRLFLTCTHL